jgi:hypothetical protein
MHKLFPSQQENEVIYLVLRQHWFILFTRLLVWFFFVAVLLGFQRFVQPVAPGLFEGTAGQVVSLFVQVYNLFLLLSLFLIWLFWYLNIQIISNLRIVDIDQVGLFSRTISELFIENIEDVTSETGGIFGTVLNYGMVYVQTAGSRERFEFDNVTNAAAVEKLILDLYGQLPKKNHE